MMKIAPIERERHSTMIDLGKYAINGTSIHKLEFSEAEFLMDSMEYSKIDEVQDVELVELLKTALRRR